MKSLVGLNRIRYNQNHMKHNHNNGIGYHEMEDVKKHQNAILLFFRHIIMSVLGTSKRIFKNIDSEVLKKIIQMW